MTKRGGGEKIRAIFFVLKSFEFVLYRPKEEA